LDVFSVAVANIKKNFDVGVNANTFQIDTVNFPALHS